jgi:energy-converting hydrogenase Eha subunit E
VSPARVRSLRRLVPALLVIGVLLMVAFDHTLTLMAGIACMLASVVCGWFLVADPDGFLDHDARAGRTDQVD